MVRIFPLRPMSTYDKFRNLYNIIVKSSKNMNNVSSDIVSIENTTKLKKGRSICDMLSE